MRWRWTGVEPGVGAAAEGAEAQAPVRMRMYDYVRRNPAAHILEVAHAFGFTHPTVMYHLRVLEAEGHLVSEAWGKRRVHFDARARFTAWEREILAILALDEASAILERVATHPGTYPKELTRDLGFSETTVKRYVPALRRLHALVEEEASFRRRLWLSPTFRRKGRALLAKLPADARPVARLGGLVRDDGETAG